MGGPVIGSQLLTGYPLPGVTLKASGRNFVRKRPTITFEVSKFSQMAEINPFGLLVDLCLWKSGPKEPTPKK